MRRGGKVEEREREDGRVAGISREQRAERQTSRREHE